MNAITFKRPRILAVSDLFTSDLKRGLSCFGRKDFTKRTRNFLKPVEASIEINMRGSYLLSILFLHITIFLPILCDGGNGTFIPTNEWQTVEEGELVLSKSIFNSNGCNWQLHHLKIIHPCRTSNSGRLACTNKPTNWTKGGETDGEVVQQWSG